MLNSYTVHGTSAMAMNVQEVRKAKADPFFGDLYRVGLRKMVTVAAGSRKNDG